MTKLLEIWIRIQGKNWAPVSTFKINDSQNRFVVVGSEFEALGWNA